MLNKGINKGMSASFALLLGFNPKNHGFVRIDTCLQTTNLLPILHHGSIKATAILSRFNLHLRVIF